MTRKVQGNLQVKNNLTVDNALELSALTASRVPVLDGSSNVIASAVTDVELGYLSGVTSAVQTQLDAKLDDFTSTTDNALMRSDGTGGDAVQDSGIIVDDSDNITGVNDLTVGGDLTVNGTTTTINTTNLDVTDKNITINDGGSDASSEGAGLTVERTGTDGSIVYEDALASKWKAGAVGSEVELANVSSAQTFQNKTMDGTSASGNNTITTDADQVTYERADGSKKNIAAGSDELEAATSDLDDAIGALDATPTNYTPTDASIVADHLEGIDSALASVADEQVKVSANDTTAKYLEDAIVVSSGSNTTNILELSTLNDGADEDLQIQIDESKIDHDALLNFVANEHVDHSAVSVLASGTEVLTVSNDDLTTDIDLDFSISAATASASADNADLILIHDDSAGAVRSQTRANFLSGLAQSSAGDIAETSFSTANNQASAADVTGFAFANGVVRSFSAHCSIIIDATADLYEEFDIQGIQKGASWEISVQSVGDESGIVFSITSAGQIQYTSTNEAGFVSGTLKFRAITTSV